MCGPPPDKATPTYDQYVQADINNQLWQYYQKYYKPMIVKYSQNVTSDANNELESKKVAGQINADIMKSARAVSPSSTVKNTKHILNVADAGADAQITGKAASKVRQIGEQQNVINIGRGQTTRALAGLEDLASMSADSAIREKERQLQSDAVMENAVGSTVGAIAGAGYGYARSLKNPPASKQEEYDDDLIKTSYDQR